VSARRWRGDAEQRRAADRGPAEDELETPRTFKRIFIQEPKLNVAWASLRYQPTKVSSHPRRLLGSAQLARQPASSLPARAPARSGLMPPAAPVRVRRAARADPGAQRRGGAAGRRRRVRCWRWRGRRRGRRGRQGRRRADAAQLADELGVLARHAGPRET
jgi:hypothetical protein